MRNSAAPRPAFPGPSSQGASPHRHPGNPCPCKMRIAPAAHNRPTDRRTIHRPERQIPVSGRSIISPRISPRTAFFRICLDSRPPRDHRLGNAHGQLDKPVIEKRNPRLQAGAHSHLVQAHQQQLRQPQIQIGVCHPFHWSRFPAFLHEAFMRGPDCVPRAGPLKAPSQSWREYLEFCAGRKSFIPAPEERNSLRGPAQHFVVHTARFPQQIQDRQPQPP